MEHILDQAGYAALPGKQSPFEHGINLAWRQILPLTADFRENQEAMRLWCARPRLY